MALKGFQTAYEAHLWPESKQGLHTRLLRGTAFIICNSGGTESEYVKAGFSNTLAVPNGVDLGMFGGAKNNPGLRSKLGLPEDKKIVMYTGHLYAWKGVDVVIEAARNMRDDSEYVFVFVGGTEKDIVKYRKIIEDEGLSNVRFLGHKEQKALPEFLAAADMLLLPNVPISEESERYTSPIKMFEYMASARPIIASDMPSIREVLNDESAVLIEPGNANALADALQSLARDPARAERLAERACADVQNFTWQKRTERILSKISRG